MQPQIALYVYYCITILRRNVIAKKSKSIDIFYSKLFIAVAAAVSFFCIPTFLVHKVQTYDVDGTAVRIL